MYTDRPCRTWLKSAFSRLSWISILRRRNTFRREVDNVQNCFSIEIAHLSASGASLRAVTCTYNHVLVSSPDISITARTRVVRECSICFIVDIRLFLLLWLRAGNFRVSRVYNALVASRMLFGFVSPNENRHNEA